MKKFAVLIFLVFFGGILMCTERVHANPFQIDDYSGYWVSADGNGQTISLDQFAGSGITEFGIYYGAESYALLTPTSGPVVIFYVENNKIVDKPGGNTLINLDATGRYGFYYKIGGDFYYTYNIYTEDTTTFVYKLTLPGNNGVNTTLISIDSTPVVAPIPPSALLLGSGVIGLIGFGVRRRRKSTS